MMPVNILSAQVRSETGSRSVRRLRRNGQIPAILYGSKQENINLLLNRTDLQIALKSRSRVITLKWDDKNETALLKEVQYDTFGNDILHVDFFRIDASKTVKVQVPIELYGAPVGLKKHGILDHLIKEIGVECLATSIPERIRVNVSHLDIGQSILVKDIEIPEGVKVTTNPDSVVASVHFVAEIKAVTEEEIAAPEMIRKERKEAEEESE